MSDLFALDGSVALVTGGNGGLGLAAARALRAAGATVVVTGRDQAKNRAVSDELEVLDLDVRDEEAVAGVVNHVVGRHGRLDILVNNAGVYVDQSALGTDLAAWEHVLATNLTGPLLCARAAAAAMIEGGRGGAIVNVGSMYSAFGHPTGVAYTASKTGVLGLTRALAVELGRHRIRVNTVVPGWFDTAMNDNVSPAQHEAIRRQTALGRWGEPGDIAGTVVYLASPASAFVTGATVAVDGGYLVTDRDLQG